MTTIKNDSLLNNQITHILGLDPRPHPSQLLHVGPYPQKQSNMHAHGPDICSCFTAHPEYTYTQGRKHTVTLSIAKVSAEEEQLAKVSGGIKFQKLAFIYGPYSQLSFHSRDKGRPLEESSN